MKNSSLKEQYQRQFKSCESKKDYKRLCKKMIKQMDAIDFISTTLWDMLSEIIGDDNCSKLVSVAMQAYIARSKGYNVKIQPVHLDDDILESLYK